jgi:hypothetical protein
MSLQYKGQDVVQAGNSADRAYATASLVSSSLIFTTIGNTTSSINLSNLSGSFSGSFTGTSSFALTSSHSTTLGASLANSSSGQLTLRNSNNSTISTISQLTASLALTASYVTALRAAGSDSQIQYNSGSTFAGTASFAFIYQSQSLQQGNHVTASGLFSHAEGSRSIALGAYSHVEGNSYAGQYGYLTEGNIVSGIIYLSRSYGDVSGNISGTHIIHRDNITNTLSYLQFDTGDNPPYFDGTNTVITLFDFSFNNSNAGTIGVYLVVNPTAANSVIGGLSAHAEGEQCFALGEASHAEGYQTTAFKDYSHAEGVLTKAFGLFSHAEGLNSIASGPYSHTEGDNTRAIGDYSHAEGSTTTASGSYSHAEGRFSIAIGIYSHAEGLSTQAIGGLSHAEGQSTQAVGLYSHAEGSSTIASGSWTHAEGSNTQAVGVASHAEGQNTIARGDYSHAEGFNTIASGSHQTVVGTYNVQNNTISEFVVGIGNALTRKDGFTVDVDANLSGSIMIPTNTANPSNPKTGSMYYNTSTNRLHIYNGTAWRSSSFF